MYEYPITIFLLSLSEVQIFAILLIFFSLSDVEERSKTFFGMFSVLIVHTNKGERSWNDECLRFSCLFLATYMWIRQAISKKKSSEWSQPSQSRYSWEEVIKVQLGIRSLVSEANYCWLKHSWQVLLVKSLVCMLFPRLVKNYYEATNAVSVECHNKWERWNIFSKFHLPNIIVLQQMMFQER
jgi:hypothetical protein